MSKKVNNLPADAPKPPSLLGYHRQLAPTAAVKVSPLCLGGMGFGTAWGDIMGSCDKEASFALMDYFYSQGGNFIDTAGNYQCGESEAIIGEWMKTRSNREEIIVATKYTSAWQLHNQDTKIQSNYGGNNKKSLAVSIDASLKALQTSYIDLYYVHSWDFTTSIPELMHSLHNLVVSGKVLYLGISNTPAWVVAKANEYARQKGLTQFSVYQGQWNAAEREIERDVVPMCIDEGIALAPFGVLGMGYFRTSAQRAAEKEEDREGRKVPFVDKPQKTAMADALEKIAEARGTYITSIALAWARTKAPYVFPIVGGRKIEHLKANIDALSIELTEEENAAIENAVPFDLGYPQAFLGGPKGAIYGADTWTTKRLGHFDWVSPPRDEVVMHAVLMISASHQHSLWPHDAAYNKSMAYHLDLTLSGFRDLLSKGIDDCDHDVVIACSLLLVHYAWSMPFFAYEDDKIDMRSEPDRLLKFAAGLKMVMKTMKDDKRYTKGLFKSPMSDATIQQYRDWEATLAEPFNFDDFFFSARSTSPPLVPGCCIESGVFNACDRLAPLLKTMDAVANGHTIHHLMLQVQVYTLFWPAKASKEFEEDVAANQTEALVVMLSFYATTWWLLSESVWWARTRTKVMCESILEYLYNNKDEKWEADIENIRRYFKFTPNGTGGWTIGEPGNHTAVDIASITP
ncbi:norsolorinic acid reductase [Trichoderma arundinaceum]|uniref:Norsolorinic acid reductase n=1 Tax=Trichoderma arundinaceum TaxID=490622 RepID=A0A395P197_TRIAR|nr:norsolorinic acid reductase [Trichoderma arundinaceum]